MWHALRILLAVLMFATTERAMAVAEPPFSVSIADAPFELREYPGFIVAETWVEGDFDAAGRAGFRRIANYIFGDNIAAGGASAKIAMTAPVTMEPSSQKIAMTAPVLMKHEGENTGMSLIVPKDVATAKVPAPKDSAVMMDSLPAGQFAVYRYSGGRNEANEQEALGKLRAWVEKRQLQVTGEPLFGYYDPPWIPPFMRRNEVMLRLAGTQP